MGTKQLERPNLKTKKVGDFMPTKKLFNVREFVLGVNRILENDSHTPEYRKGVADLTGNILQDLNCYAGFNYLDWMNGGFQAWQEAGEPDFPEKNKYLGDQTKVFFYIHSSLKEEK